MIVGTLIDDAFYAWTDVIGQVVNLILSNPITASFFGVFICLVITNVISQIFNSNGEKGN